MDSNKSFSQFGQHFQTKLIQSLLIDNKFFDRVYDILNREYFDSTPHNFIYQKIQEYFEKYKVSPTLDNLEVIILSENDELLRETCYEIIRTIKKSHVTDVAYIKDESIKFCRNQKIKSALNTSINLWEQGKYDDIPKIMSDALKAGEENTLGHNYFQHLELRLAKLKRFPIATGLVHLDEYLNGGLARGELGIIMASVGVGKCTYKNTKIKIEVGIIEVEINNKFLKFFEFELINTKRGCIYARDLLETDEILI